MMRSLFSGVSGLQNHQTRMDVIGNNISNVNTYGFKRGRVNFQDMISQTLQGASRPTDEIGGVNPKQVGLGMFVASIDTIHTQGSLQKTDVQTDLAIQGEGFFIVKEGDKLYFTRDGSFTIDSDGYLLNPANGFKVQGWVVQEVGGQTIINTSSQIQDLIIPIGGKDPARATETVYFACNLDKRYEIIPEGTDPGSEMYLENSWRSSIEIFDSYGRKHILEVFFRKDETVQNRWRCEVVVDPQAFEDRNLTVEGGTADEPNVFYLDFDNTGALEDLLDTNGNSLLAEGELDARLDLSFDVPLSDLDEGGAPYRQTLTLDLGQIGSYENSITQSASTSSTKITEQDGYTMGYLESFKIDQSGVITGVYSNGTVRELGQIALATFINPGGLEKAGENTYIITNNSGEANIGPSGVGGKGSIFAGFLEMSNVDLATEFTDMIITQRGFQANSRTITTSDQMLQELLTLKR
jgi:flagellar hook protein FlgE